MARNWGSGNHRASGQEFLWYSCHLEWSEAPGELIVEVPVNLKDEDNFHITIEEYLHALVSMTEELARLAVNAVTLGDYARPLEISKFVKVGAILFGHRYSFRKIVTYDRICMRAFNCSISRTIL